MLASPDAGDPQSPQAMNMAARLGDAERLAADALNRLGHNISDRHITGEGAAVGMGAAALIFAAWIVRHLGRIADALEADRNG